MLTRDQQVKNEKNNNNETWVHAAPRLFGAICGYCLATFLKALLFVCIWTYTWAALVPFPSPSHAVPVMSRSN